MNFATGLIVLVTVEYFIAGLAYAFYRDWGSVVLFTSYGTANLGYLYSKGFFG